MTAEPSGTERRLWQWQSGWVWHWRESIRRKNLAKGKFADPTKLLDHYARHGGDFRAKNADEYERLAEAFLEGPADPAIIEKNRQNGDKVRYNILSQEFAIARPDGTIRTYFKPDPAVHGFPTNVDYFNAQ